MKSMIKLFNKIVDNDISPNGLYLLYCIKHRKKPKSINEQYELRFLIIDGFLDEDYKLTEKGENLIETIEASYEIKDDNTTIVKKTGLTKKDLENIKGDVANNYQTIPVLFGENFSKKIISVLTVSTIIPIYFLIEIFEVGYMDIYFYVSLIVLIFFIQKLWKSETKTDYLMLHNILKFLVVSGVFCIVLIEPEVLIRGKKIVEIIVK